MTALKGHHRPRVEQGVIRINGLRRWWAFCRCGWARPGDDWHAAYTFARDHAEGSLS